MQKFKKQLNGGVSKLTNESHAETWNGGNGGAFRPIESLSETELSRCSLSGLNGGGGSGIDGEEHRFVSLVNKCGGETNSPSNAGASLPYPLSHNTSQQGARQSRPGSSMSQTNAPTDRRSYSGMGGTSGGGSGGNPSTTDYLMSQETNRQILLILVRLREDTNNVLTRLSFLESSVVSLQVLSLLLFVRLLRIF